MNRVSLLLVAALTTSLPVPAFAQEVNLVLRLRSTPCRVLDTRIAAPSIPAGGTRPFSVGPTAASSQGGTSGCGVPAEAVAVKLIVHSAPTVAPSGYLKVFNAGGDGGGTYASVILQGAGQWVASSLDVPIYSSHVVGIYSIVEADAVVDIAGWYTEKVPDVSVVEAGTIANLSALPDSTSFDLQGGHHVTCVEPFLDPASCSEIDNGECWAAAGHTLSLYGNVTLYAHEVFPCPAP